MTRTIRNLRSLCLPFPNVGFRVLRVIYNESNDPVTVVTAYFDDKVKNV